MTFAVDPFTIPPAQKHASIEGEYAQPGHQTDPLARRLSIGQWLR
jgi:hypothetical protein